MPPPPSDSCEIAPGETLKNGYKRIVRDGKKWRAHRWRWTQTYGPIPDGLWVLHKCDNPACWRLDHLFLGTRQDNIDDMHSKGRGAKHEKHSSAKLTYADVEVIRRSPLSGNELARRFGVSSMAISKVRTNKTWV